MTMQERREALSLTQQDLAALAGVTPGQVAIIESETPLVFADGVVAKVTEALAYAEGSAKLRAAGWVEFDPRETGP